MFISQVKGTNKYQARVIYIKDNNELIVMNIESKENALKKTAHHITQFKTYKDFSNVSFSWPLIAYSQ